VLLAACGVLGVEGGPVDPGSETWVVWEANARTARVVVSLAVTRSLHPLHRRLLAVQRATIPEAEPVPASPAEIAAAAELLGRPLPPGYRRFLEEVGRVFLPVDIHPLADHASGGDWPPWFVPFAGDLSGNYWGFDIRRKRGKELPIEFWDHEEPEMEDAPSDPTPFEEWLEEQIATEEATLLERRREALLDALPHRDPYAFTPERDQVREVEAALGMALPLDYVWFTTTVGSIAEPVRVVDALELAALTEAMRATHHRAGKLVAFAEEGPGRYAAFARGGAVRGLGIKLPASSTFLTYLEDRVARRVEESPNLAARPKGSPPRDDESLAEERAARLLDSLISSGALETTRGFPRRDVARSVAAAWARPARILSLLEERDDVVEIFVSEDELAKAMALVT
jgi:hypothetical protein